jgi:acid stress-induced BolA-like protein IbaG/YrbA
MRDEIIQLLSAGIRVEHIDVDLSGNHCTVTVVSEEFEGLSRVKKQQKVYQCLNEKIASGEIHALNIQALTPTQWREH